MALVYPLKNVDPYEYEGPIDHTVDQLVAFGFFPQKSTTPLGSPTSTTGFAYDAGNAFLVIKTEGTKISLQIAGNEYAWLDNTGLLSASKLAAVSNLYSPNLDTAAAGALAVGETNATSVSIGRSGYPTLVNGRLAIGGASALPFFVQNAAGDILQYGGNPRLYLQCPTGINGLRIDSDVTPVEVRALSSGSLTGAAWNIGGVSANGTEAVIAAAATATSGAPTRDSPQLQFNPKIWNGAASVTPFQGFLYAKANSTSAPYGGLSIGVGSDNLYIRSDGRVGIGTLSPSSALHVVGVVTSSGGFDASSGTLVIGGTNASSITLGRALASAIVTMPGPFTATAMMSSYTSDGLFGATAVPCSISTPGGTNRKILFGFTDGGSGQYGPRLGFTQPTAGGMTAAQMSLGPELNGDFTIRGGASNTEHLRIDTTGTVKLAGRLSLPATDSSSTPGSVTINSPTGQFAVAAGSASATVTNSSVSATSVVLCVIQSADATLTGIVSVVPSAGSFVFTGNANATAACKVGFIVVN